MKEWESEIVIKIHDIGREAPTEEAYRTLVKDQFREDHNFELTDDEITVRSYERTGRETT